MAFLCGIDGLEFARTEDPDELVLLQAAVRRALEIKERWMTLQAQMIRSEIVKAWNAK